MLTTDTLLSGVHLRDYQVGAIEAVERAAARGVRRPLVVLPTGSGKTITFSELIRRRGGRALILAHRDELLQQAADKVRMALPAASIGFVKGERDEIDAQVVIASVQTLARPERLARIQAGFETVIVDEAHHATADTYRRILQATGSFDRAGPLTLGVTATAERADDADLSDIWTEIVYERSIPEMIRAGYLVDLRAVRVSLEMDLSSVRTRGRDFDDIDLARAMLGAQAPRYAVEAYQRYAPGRKALAFAPTVEVAHAMAGAFRAAGVSAAAVDGRTPEEERRTILAQLRDSEIAVLSNVGVLTEGYDEPSIDCLIMARPTKSRPLYIQSLGRGLRLYPEKQDCLVIDLVGNTAQHDLITLPSLFGVDRRHLRDHGLLKALAAIPRPSAPADARLTAQPAVLFERSAIHWVKVRDDVFALSIAGGLIVIQQAPSGWDVSVQHKDRGSELLGQGLQLGYAQGAAEDYVRRLGANGLASGDAPWRSAPASDKQRDALRRFGARIPPGLTAGEASDLLAAKIARRSLGLKDPPTERQLGALRRLRVPIPDGLGREEASRLLAAAHEEAERRRQEDPETAPATARQVETLRKLGVAMGPDLTLAAASRLLDDAITKARAQVGDRSAAPATEKQVAMLRRMGVPIPDGLGMNAASRLIDQARSTAEWPAGASEPGSRDFAQPAGPPPATEQQMAELRRLGVAIPENLDALGAQRLIIDFGGRRRPRAQPAQRRAPEAATPRQLETLTRLGIRYGAGISKRDASQLLDQAIQQNRR